MRLRAQIARAGRSGRAHILRPGSTTHTVCGRELDPESIRERSKVEWDADKSRDLRLPDKYCNNCLMLVQAYAMPSDGWEVVSE